MPNTPSFRLNIQDIYLLNVLDRIKLNFVIRIFFFRHVFVDFLWFSLLTLNNQILNSRLEIEYKSLDLFSIQCFFRSIDQ